MHLCRSIPFKVSLSFYLRRGVYQNLWNYGGGEHIWVCGILGFVGGGRGGGGRGEELRHVLGKVPTYLL